MLVHQLSGSLLLGGLDRRCDLSVVVVDRAVNRCPSRERESRVWSTAKTARRRSRAACCSSRRSPWSGSRRCGRTVLGPRRSGWPGIAARSRSRCSSLRRARRASRRGPRARPHLEELLQRHVRRRGHQAEPRAQRLRECLGAGDGHVRAAADAFRGADQALRGEQASASRTVARLTPKSSASCSSFGRRSPRASSSVTMSCRSRSRPARTPSALLDAELAVPGHGHRRFFGISPRPA